MIRFGVVVHGGVGHPSSEKDGCEAAARAGAGILREGGGALEAVLESAVALEDDGRYNAGSGSNLRLDGKTIEMDAAVMDSEGNLGAVAGIALVKNPVRVAREVIRTPHVFLSGRGATDFARQRGFEEFYRPSEAAQRKHRRVVEMLRGRKLEDVREAWKDFDLKANWNFDVPYREVFGCDTVGAVAVDLRGGFAVANSTGGVSLMLQGRVGDSPIVGSGFYAGPAGAVAATGIGEEIIRRMLARQVYDWISHGEEVRAACERGVALFPASVPAGVIAVSRRGAAAAANRDMASSLHVDAEF